MVVALVSRVQHASLVLRAGLGVLLLGSLLFASLLAASPARAQQDGVPASEETSSDEGTTTLTIPSDKASASNPSLTEAQQARVDSLKLQASFATVADNHDVVVRNLTEVLRLVPSDSSLYDRLGMAYDAQWQYEKAAIAYRKAIERGMDTPDMQRQLALSLTESRQYEAAAPIFSDLLKSYPSNVPLRMAYAKTLAGRGRTQAAIDDLEILNWMYPKSPGLVAVYAEVLWVDGQTQASFDLVRGYIDERPEEPFMYSLLGEMHLRNGDVDAAHQVFLNGKNVVKRRSSYTRAIFDSGMTYTFARKGDPEQALRHAEFALEHMPYNPYLYRNRGLALLEDGQHAAACDAFQESLDRGYERLFLEKTQFGPTPSSLLKRHCE